ncbi:MAG TPA: AtzG-like protein [Burkholderiales bacterium]|nr:AtzG-like protein [Burkholderiales bacterium]
MRKTIDGDYVLAAARIAQLPLSAGDAASVTAQLQRVEEIAQPMLEVALEPNHETGLVWRP